MRGDRIHSVKPDGSDYRTIVTDCHLPDGIVVDAEAGHIFWTNMGVPDLDGKNECNVLSRQGNLTGVAYAAFNGRSEL